MQRYEEKNSDFEAINYKYKLYTRVMSADKAGPHGAARIMRSCPFCFTKEFAYKPSGNVFKSQARNSDAFQWPV